MKRFLKLAAILLVVIFIYNRFTRQVFYNVESGGEPNFFKFLEWKLTRNKPQWPELEPNKITSLKPRFARINQLNITYINHSSFLIQTNNLNIITDPIWSDYAGPFGKFGVKRSIYPGIALKDLPQIDIILISHSHYDHLDLPTINELTKTNKPIIITGLGVSKLIDYCTKNSKKCFELNWWDKAVFENTELKIDFVPAHHWSRRYLFDHNTTLWGGFVINNGKKKIYFSGDTGFGSGKIFKQIAQKFDKINIALLPIGAYKPEWFFSVMHTTPYQAVKIFKILQCDYAIPMHYDVFELTDENYDDPLNDLTKALLEEKIAKEKFIILKPGHDLLSIKSNQ